MGRASKGIRSPGHPPTVLLTVRSFLPTALSQFSTEHPQPGISPKDGACIPCPPLQVFPVGAEEGENILT